MVNTSKSWNNILGAHAGVGKMAGYLEEKTTQYWESIPIDFVKLVSRAGFYKWQDVKWM